MIFLFTDFGADDVYVGQVHARLRRELAHANVLVIDLLHAAPVFDVPASAHLLAALSSQIGAGDVCMAVVDPGVGGARDAVAVRADRRWYVGPDNGMLSVVAARAHAAEVFRIVWRPEVLSVSFHGRDLFAPVAAQLANGDLRALAPKARLEVEFGGADLAQIIYIDHYGNAMTGLRAESLKDVSAVGVAGHTIAYAPVFVEAVSKPLFWYRNSLGLLEIAVFEGSAAERFGLRVGDPISVSMR